MSLSSSRQKTVTTSLRLTPEERAVLDAVASAEGIGPSAFARVAVLRSAGMPATPRRRRRAELATLVQPILGELSRIGNNINQISRHLNSGIATPADLDAFEGIRRELERLTLQAMALTEPSS